ncbi:MAG TPA: hypothetical protein VKB39_07610 [Candidatus Baltobacteraceae bacterium]|nr:hypothetical protein [Candidatus Baltobacteraceae bacterium]
MTYAQTAGTPELVTALQRLRTVDPSFVVAWSIEARPPGSAPGTVNEFKKQILALDSSDREAMLFWLRSHGRDALHQRGVTDAEIGAPLYPIDYKIVWVPMPEGFVNPTPIPTATPEPPPTPKPQPPKSRGIWGFIIPVAVAAISNVASPKTTIASSSTSSGHTTSSMESHMVGNTHVTTYQSSSSFSSSSSSASVGVDMRGVAGMLANEALKEHPTSAPLVQEVASSSAARNWTLLEFGRQRSDTLTSGITVNNGVAGVRSNSEGAACLGFTNRNEKAVREIDFDFTLIDAHDRSLQSIALHRAATIAPNETSAAPSDAEVPAVAREGANCVTIGSSSADAPALASLSRAVAMAYEIRRVVFDDGTTWMRPGANLWPHEESTLKQSTEP